MLRLRVFGTLQVENDRPGAVDDLLAQPKAVALLAYLALARPHGFHQRDLLVGLFWPELDQEHARSSLRKLLSRLRQNVGEGVLETRGTESIGLARTEYWCDAVEFERAIQEDRLRDALDLHHGDLIPGFFIPGAFQFERWLEDERARYRELAVGAAWALVERYVGDSKLTNASQLARVVARLAPSDERMLRRVMTMLVRLGDHAGAVQIFTRFADRLWKELETRPSPETLQLVASIRTSSTITETATPRA